MTSKVRGSLKLAAFSDSIFPEMTRLAQRYDAVNLSQGFPDFPAPAALKQAACDAILGDVNQYSISFGARSLREALPAQFTRRHGVAVDAEEDVTICCGSTEAMLATMLACVDPGDEVIVFEPFYENYGPGAIMAGATPKYVKLSPPHWTFDPDQLAGAFSNRTRAIVINTPTNPTGKVFTRDELTVIADLCQRWDAIAISDEIYEHIVFDGHQHLPIASLPGMAERTVTISGLSKTYSVTGWRIGWAIAPAALSDGIRKMHDFLTVAAPSPLQEAGAMALELPDTLLPRDERRVSALARLARRHPRAQGIRLLSTVRRVLPDDRHLRLWLSRTTSSSRSIWFRTSAWPRFPAAASTSNPRDGCVADSVLFLEARGDDPRSGAPAREAATGGCPPEGRRQRMR